MDSALAPRIELVVDIGASAVFATAMGFAVRVGLAGQASGPALVAASCIAGVLGMALVYRLLRRVEPHATRVTVPIFDVRDLDAVADKPDADEPLLLDDILAELGPDSRVVRLFDVSAMPSPAELKARIDAHLQPAAATDASEELHEALAELRRSLR